MNKWETFGQKMANFVANLDATKIQFLPYAMTYAQHILVNLDEGKAMGYTPEDATKTQMLYVISNLEGATEEELKKIEAMCEEVGINISDAIQETMEANEK